MSNVVGEKTTTTTEIIPNLNRPILTYSAVRRGVGKIWGLRQAMVRYTEIIQPMTCY